MIYMPTDQQFLDMAKVLKEAIDLHGSDNVKKMVVHNELVKTAFISGDAETLKKMIRIIALGWGLPTATTDW